MENTIKGIHHITAIAGDAKRNYDFYTRILGLRLVKKTVNFDDPNTYHLYYGDGRGTPGSILTFFPWGNIAAGRQGSRQATAIGYSVPENSFDFWQERFMANGIKCQKAAEKFGEPYLTVFDPDGLKLELIAAKTTDARIPWETEEVTALNATKGFHNITITCNRVESTAEILTGVFGYRLLTQHGNNYRFITDAVDHAAIVDLNVLADEKPGHVSGGSVHHVAFRVKNEEILMEYREKIATLGLTITGKIDRSYFYSLYFREPGGVLFELATENPGFSIDEPVGSMGTSLMLPPQYEELRGNLEISLPKLL
jgi:glyoxalase family protein